MSGLGHGVTFYNVTKSPPHRKRFQIKNNDRHPVEAFLKIQKPRYPVNVFKTNKKYSPPRKRFENWKQAPLRRNVFEIEKYPPPRKRFQKFKYPPPRKRFLRGGADLF